MEKDNIIEQKYIDEAKGWHYNEDYGMQYIILFVLVLGFGAILFLSGAFVYQTIKAIFF